MNKHFLYLLFIVVFSSCVTTKQMTYFQGEPISKSDIYKLNNEPYRLQVNDILFIDIKAENPEIVAIGSISFCQSSHLVFIYIYINILFIRF